MNQEQKYRNFCQELTNELLAMQLGFSEELLVTVYDNSIRLGIEVEKNSNSLLFASDVIFSIERTSIISHLKAKINFGSSGAFSPENKASYWRTIHAAIILQNWGAMNEIFSRYCKRYREEIISTTIK